MIKPPKGQPKNDLYNTVPELHQCLAKTIENAGKKAIPGTDVLSHCIVVGSVAKALVERHPDKIRERLFPPGVELIAAAHDVGKVHPHFLEKLLRSTDYVPNSFPGLEYADPDLDREVGFHSGVSQVAVADVGRYIPEILGAHHGKPPDFTKLRPATAEILGGVGWQSRRLELLQRLKEFFSCDWPVVEDDINALLLTGLTTVCDWIGSSRRFEGYRTDASMNLDSMVNAALDEAGFIFPKIRPGLRFEQLFDGYSPRPMQSEFISMVNEPGIYVLEDRMGQGKTEAALAAAYSLLEKGESKGIYFALPTQLTSDSIYSRFARFLDLILDDSDQHKAGLLHGKAWLFDMEMGEDARPGYSWFEPQKRGLLAPFAVGTIDQALMAVLNVRHGFVRTFGLAGKTVVLDEVHTYDAYTGCILDELVQALYQLGCTVIILSATLTAKQVESFFQAGSGIVRNSEQYPRCIGISSLHPSESRVSQPVVAESSSIRIDRMTDDDLAYKEVFSRVSEGQYVLWIENTVQEAQDVFKILSAWAGENNCAAGLLHSRFTGKDRKKSESTWVHAYGKQGRMNSDGSGKILVGTQVLEQSLDIDADFLVTRLAPTDMLLQRIGRLWRHRMVDPYRVPNTLPKVIILTPDNDLYLTAGKNCFGASQYVYAPYVLSRTYEVWRDLERIEIPADLRQLLEATYCDRPENSALGQQYSEMKQETDKLQRFARIGMAKAGLTWADTAPTRHKTQETRNVLLLREKPGRNSTDLIFADDSRIALPPTASLSAADRKYIARVIHEHLIPVPIGQTPAIPSLSDLKWLTPFMFVGSDEPLVSVAIVTETGEIRNIHGGEASKTHELYYFKSLGYVTKKRGEGDHNG